jgi:hypothetical protein
MAPVAFAEALAVPLCVLIFLYPSVSDNTRTKRVMTGGAEDLEVKVSQNSL